MLDSDALTLLSEGGGFPTEAVTLVVLFGGLAFTAVWLYYLYR